MTDVSLQLANGVVSTPSHGVIHKLSCAFTVMCSYFSVVLSFIGVRIILKVWSFFPALANKSVVLSVDTLVIESVSQSVSEGSEWL